MAAGPRRRGGAGGTADATATGSNAGGETHVTTLMIGGNGGVGIDGANGGDGASVSKTNAVSGSNPGGKLVLSQTVEAGGGGGTDSGHGGAGGSGSSSLTFTDSTASILSVDTEAMGSGGGAGKTGGAGGSGVATLIVTGAHEVDLSATAFAGGGGASSRPGISGDATATATGTGASVTVSSTAIVATDAASFGVATARSAGTGSSGTVSSQAEAHSISLIYSMQLNTSVTLNGQASTDAAAAIGKSAQGFTSTQGAVAVGEGAPTTADVQAALAKSPTITAAFGAHPSYFALTELGGGHFGAGSDTQTVVSTFKLLVDVTKLTDLQDLLVGTFKAVNVGPGVTDVTLKIAGAVTGIYQDLGNGAQAKAFLHDHPFDLGQLPGPTLVNHLDWVNVELDVTTNAPGSGFYLGLIIGDPPPLDGGHAASSTAMSAHHDWML